MDVTCTKVSCPMILFYRNDPINNWNPKQLFRIHLDHKNAEYPISNFPISYFRRTDSYNDVISDKIGISDFNGKRGIVAWYWNFKIRIFYGTNRFKL